MAKRKPLLNKIQKAVLNNLKPLTEYTLWVRNNPDSRPKRVQVKATKYKQAVDIATSRYRGKWINYSLARKMDLISARAEATKRSAGKDKVAYVILRKDEFVVEKDYKPSKDDVYAKFAKGQEDKEFLESLKPKEKAPASKETQKNNTNIKTSTVMKTKEAPAKKSAAPAKKVSAKKESKPAKKEAPAKRAKYTDGKKVTMTNAQMTAKIKKGYMYFNEQGVNKTKYIPERPNQDLKNENYYEVAPK